MRKKTLFIIAALLFCSPHRLLVAASILDDFCASSQAQSDLQAKSECDEYKRLQKASADKEKEKNTVQNEISKLDSDIKLAEQRIKIQNTIISKLSNDIGAKAKVVNQLEARIESNIASIGSVVQKVNERDSVSMPEILLSQKHFSDFYRELDEYTVINRELVELVDRVKADKEEAESQKDVLEDRKDRETAAKAAIEAERALINRRKADKAILLKAKTSELSAIQGMVDAQRQRVAQIRSQIIKFQDGEPILFGDAYDAAAKAAKTTGVRPAFILSILQQESSFDREDVSYGKNIGSCYLTNLSTGDGMSVTTGATKIRVMNPSRDVPVFQKIAETLGFGIGSTRVSCWIAIYDSKGNPTGWGGAMGAAQFIPSTWAIYGGYPKPNYSYDASKDRVRKALGLSEPSSPFNPQHAIAASSLFLGDLGAGLQTYGAEKDAACRYYSGSACPSGKKYYTKREQNIINYGKSVADRAIQIQRDMIDPLLE